jgi:hypothetical protein
MKSKRNIKRSLPLFVFFMQIPMIMILLLSTVSSHGQTEMLTVISNEKGAPAALKFSELKSILKGEKQRWRDGNKISIALMKTSTPAGAYTCKKIYDMSSDELKKFWLALVFEGKADAPVFFNTVAEIESFVAENPGAIGIIDQPAANNDTHTVLIDGKKFL